MATAHQKTTQMIVVAGQQNLGPHQGTEKVALFNEDGSPFGLAGDSVDSDWKDSVESRLAALESKK